MKTIVTKDKPKKGVAAKPAAKYVVRTPLGRRLEEIRKRIVASGEPLLNLDDIERELGRSRGEDD